MSVEALHPLVRRLPVERPSGPGAAASGPEAEALAALDRADPDRALSILMRAYGEGLYRYCHQMLRDEDLTDEVHQMTFVQAYESFGGFARRSSFKTWLFGIARHRCLDALKARRRRWRRFRQADTVPETADPARTDEERLVGRDLVRSLRDCLAELAPRVRTAVLWRFQEGLSYVDMERASGERAPTLQARVARALPVLRRCLEAKGLAP